MVTTLSIVIPCYNESKNLPLILETFKASIHRDDVEVILVDNGSTDDSARILEELMADFPFARSVRVQVNQGYGFGILSGLKAAAGNFLGWTHADLQTDPADVLHALDLLESQENPSRCYIKGNRKGRPIFDQFFTIGMALFESAYLGESLWDVNAQPNIFSRSFFETWQNPPMDFSLDLYALYMARKQHLQILTFDVIFPPRLHGQSRWNTGIKAKWKFIQRTLEFSIKLKRELKNGNHRASS